MVSNRVPGLQGMAPILTGAAPVLLHGLTLSTLAPLFITPMTIIACDPFLFVELLDEPGKLRHLGHWYWQDVCGRKKLHLHV